MLLMLKSTFEIIKINDLHLKGSLILQHNIILNENIDYC